MAKLQVARPRGKVTFASGISVLALLFGCVGPCTAAMVILQQGVNSYQGTSDTAIFEDFPNNSSGGFPTMFAGINKGASARRSLIRFNLAGQIPAGATVTSVTLQLYLDYGRQVITFQTLKRMKTSWGEGSNPLVDPEHQGPGEPAQPGDATWMARFFGGSLWTNSGGDFESINSGIAYSDVYWKWLSINGINMANDVQLWLTNPAQNFGWILMGDESGFQNANRFSSSEAATDRPRLLIEYTPASAVQDWTLY